MLEVNLGFLSTFMIFVWVISFWKKNPGFVDFFWSIALTLSGAIYLTQNLTFRNGIVLALLGLWGIRLATHMYFDRIKNNVVEKRYMQLSQNWKISKWVAFFINFQFQGLLVFVMTLSFWFSSRNSATSLNFFDYCGVFLCIVGIAGEMLADHQLQQSKKLYPGKVCQLGLWNYSRHPNLFFDWMTWCGLAFFSLSTTRGWIGVISPITLFVIMNFMTLPITEKMSIKSKGNDYLNYQAKTAKFFIWFKKS